jgi:ubiquitin
MRDEHSLDVTRRKNPKTFPETLEASALLDTGAHVEATYQVDDDDSPPRLVKLVFTGEEVGSDDLRAFSLSEFMVFARFVAATSLTEERASTK